MAAPGWLTGSLADVPAGDAWLSERERRVLAGLRVAKRVADWRLGRWTAKEAVGAWLDVPPWRIEILAAADGAPEAWLEGARAPVSVSLSHRAGRSLAAVTGAPAVIGCDLELVEPRSPAFVREWLAPAEQTLLVTLDGPERDRVANLMWSAKEAAAKVRRGGLRLDVRRAAVAAPEVAVPAAAWRPLRVDWEQEGTETAGWWRDEPCWVMTIAGDPAPGLPRLLSKP